MRRNAFLLIGLAGLFFCSAASAADSVKIGERTYHCQNTCIVGRSNNGGLTVRDSGWGWVAVFVEDGHIDHQGPTSVNKAPILTTHDRREVE